MPHIPKHQNRSRVRSAALAILVGLTTALVALSPVGPAAAADTALASTATLGSGQEIRVTNGHQLVMQTDGNLVVYRRTGPSTRAAVWATGTNGHPGAYLTMQSDGNAVIYQSTGPASRVALWASGTSGHPGAYLVMQEDSNVVIYQPTAGGRSAIWATGTSAPTTPPGPGRTCSPSLTMTLSKASGNPANLTMRVNGTRANCNAIGATFPAASGTGRNQCIKSVGWLPSGKYFVDTYHQNGHGTLAGRSEFHLTSQAGTAMCGRSGFAIHSDDGVRVPSTRTTFTHSSNGCIKISGAHLTSLKSIVDNYRADGGRLIGLTVG